MMLTKKNNLTKGFTLVEILVAVVIGLIAMVVMFQIFSVTEARKRTTAGTGDIQSVANIALVNLQNQILQAGYGFTSSGSNMGMNIFGCRVILRNQNANGVTLSRLAPVIINDPLITGQDAQTDTLLIVSGTTVGSQEGSFLEASVVIDSSSFIYQMMSNATFKDGDAVIAVSSGVQETCQTDTDPLVIGRVTLLKNAEGKIEKSAILVDRGANVTSGTLYNLGPLPGTANLSGEQVFHVRGYRIAGGQLQECDFALSNCSNASDWLTIASDMVSLKAQYVFSDGSFNKSTPDGVSPSGDNIHCQFAKIVGIRLALMARHTQRNKEQVTTSANRPSWSGEEITDHTNQEEAERAAFNLDLAADNDDAFYRYTVFETSVPLRNVIWMGALDGCSL